MKQGKTFTVNTTDGLTWQVYAGFIAPDFIQAQIVKSNDPEDIGAGFSASLKSIGTELRGLIEAKM